MLSLTNANTTAIDQLCHLLEQLNNANYSQPLNVLHNNTIGKHVRHVAEFYQTFLQGLATGIVNYDNRQRNIRLETDIAFTIEQLTQIKTALQHIDLNKPLQLSVAYTQDAAQQIPTNPARELVYLIEHTIHHLAILRIAVDAHFSFVNLPNNFGIAYSTVKHQQTKGTTAN